MISEEFQIISENGIYLNIKTWLPETSPRAIVCMVHDLGEHAERYKHFAPIFTAKELGIYILDLRCHGHSEGKRGAGNLSAYISDVQELITTARRDYNDLPIFLFGHGLGGLLVASYLAKMVSREISGAILSSPWLELAITIPKLKYRLASALKPIFPTMTFSNEIDANELANNPAVGEKYVQDPLVHNRISARLFFDIESGAKNVFEKASRINLPILLCHGNADAIISSSGTKKFAEMLSSAEMKIWENAKHEPHNDFDKEKVVEHYANWLINRL